MAQLRSSLRRLQPAADQEEIEKMRTEEPVALPETIKVLNDDDALDLFQRDLAECRRQFCPGHRKSHGHDTANVGSSSVSTFTLNSILVFLLFDAKRSALTSTLNSGAETIL